MAPSLTSSNQEGKGPKLEDFLGGYSENANEENQSHHPVSNYHDLCYQSSDGLGIINVNKPPTLGLDERRTEEGIHNSYHFFQAFHHQPNHSIQEIPTLKPLVPNSNSNTTPVPSSMYNVGMDGSSSISGIKSWLRQNQYVPEKQLLEPSECNIQSLTLSMSPGMHSGSSKMVPAASSSPAAADGPKYPNAKSTAREPVPRKSIETFGQRTSQYRGVTRHRWTGRYEAHLWDNSCRKEGQTRKGRQGGYDKEEKAARAYDLASLKYWGSAANINFPLSTYEKELEEMKHMTRQEFVANLRRKSSGFSRGASVYRGVTRSCQFQL